MKNRNGEKIFLQHMFFLDKWYKIVLLFLFQFFIFIFLLVFFWWMVSKNFFYAFAIQLVVAFTGTLPYRYMTSNSESIRKKYHEKYKELSFQYLWFHFQSYTIPFLSSSLYFPIILKTDYFLPSFIEFPSHFLTDTFLPVFVALPLGIFLIVTGFLIRKPSGGFGDDVESYFYILYPEKSKLITDGFYKYVRNPRYLGRGFVAIGLGVLANNCLAVIVGLIHFLAFCSLIPAEDRELSRRFGEEFDRYKGCVPALFPRFDKLGEFIRLTFFVKNNY